EGKNIHNTPHTYTAITEEQELKALVEKLLMQKEICFDTETTGLDANNTDLVGLSFAWKPGEAYYVACSTEREKAVAMLSLLQPLFVKKDITWVGQNIK